MVVEMVWNPQIEETTDKRHRSRLNTAYRYANMHSDDPKTKTGAVLTEPVYNPMISTGL